MNIYSKNKSATKNISGAFNLFKYILNIFKIYLKYIKILQIYKNSIIYITRIIVVYYKIGGVLVSEESKRDRFIRVAEGRTNKIINLTRLLANCSNKNTYEYNSEDVNKIFVAIENEIKEARRKFNESSSK